MKIRMVPEANPVGQAHDVLDRHITLLKEQWDVENPSIPWWKFWKRRASIMKVVSFLIDTLDGLIVYVDEFMDLEGKDKKATVLRAIEILYDYIVKEVIPIWLRPMSGAVKELIINVVISYAIDWIVDKYRSGLWRESDDPDSNNNDQLEPEPSA